MITTRPNGSLYTKVEQHIATVEFGHPASNSFPLELLIRLAKEFDKLSIDNEVHVIILKSQGERAFCAGASFDELLAIATIAQGKEFFSGFASVINAMRTCSKPIIGRIQGKTVGGGVGLAAACDYCIATEAASVRLSELSIGIGPFVIEPAVRRKIGVAAMNALSFDPTHWQNAYWAKEQGLFTKVVATIKDLDVEIETLASQLANYNPEAVQTLKKISWEGTANWATLLTERAALSGALALSDTTKKVLNSLKK